MHTKKIQHFAEAAFWPAALLRRTSVLAESQNLGAGGIHFCRVCEVLTVSQAAHFYDNEILGYQAQSYRGKSSKKEWWYVAASKNCPDTGRRGPSTISLKNLC